MKNKRQGMYSEIQEIRERYQFILANKSDFGIRIKMLIQVSIAASFLLLTITNLIAESYFMMGYTFLGCVLNGVAAFLSKKYKKYRLCAISAVTTCTLLFLFFLIYGGNDGFAGLWMVLLPFFCMMVMDFAVGFYSSLFLQIAIIVVLWTPIREALGYPYNDQFCLRFPLLFFISFIHGLALTILLQKSQYDELQYALQLKEMTEKTDYLSKHDTLTGLPNRRYAFEEFSTRFAGSQPHCIVMGDVDCFKKINDTYGHKFGDEVLVYVAKCFNDILPGDYLKSRWGGEEFLVAANDNLQNVYELIEKLREFIAQHEFVFEQTAIHITITFGIAEYNDISELDEAILLCNIIKKPPAMQVEPNRFSLQKKPPVL